MEMGKLDRKGLCQNVICDEEQNERLHDIYEILSNLKTKEIGFRS